MVIMKKNILFLLTFSLSTGLLCEKAHSLTHKNVNECVNRLSELVEKPSFHSKLDNGASYFIGKYKGEDGIILQDKSGNFRFISKNNVDKPKSIKLNKNEFYSVGLEGDKIVMKSGKSNKPPILTILIDNDDDFFESLRVLIRKYGDNVISELREKKDNGKQELGAKEYKAFSTCEKLGAKVSGAISSTSYKYMHQLPSYTTLDFTAINNVKNKPKKAAKSTKSSASKSAE